MPDITPIQQSFAAGELSPEMGARSDTAGYQAGLGTMKNFIADPRGPAISRNGFRYLGEVGEAGEGGQCGPGEYFESGSPVFAQGTNNIDYSETLGYVVMSCGPANGLSGGDTTVVFDEATGAEIRSFDECNRTGHKIVSTPSTQDRKFLIRYFWLCQSTNARSIYLLDMENSFAQIGFVQLGGGGLSNTLIRGERDEDVLFADDTTSINYYLVDKLDWSGSGVTTLNTPSGWACVGAAAFNPLPGEIPDRYLLCMNNGTQFGFVEYLTGSISTPSVLLDPVGGDHFITYQSNPVVVEDKIWWMFTTGQAGKINQYLIRTDLDGSNQLLVPMYDDLIQTTSGDGLDRVRYEASNNSLYYMYADELWRYEISTYRYFQCLPAYPDGLEVTPPQRSQGFVRVNGYHWGLVQQTGTGPETWGAEKILATF